MRGVVVAGTHSGSGKTTIALGIMAAFRKMGLAVQPFKAGPDFIDAGLHRLSADRTSRNLDLWMCGPDYVQRSFAKHASHVDIAVVEGVMGLYDGDQSTANLASLLDLPVVLVVDAYGMAESAGAMVKGFVEFGANCPGRGPRFAGIVFNRVASDGHYARLKGSVRDIPVLGYMPRDTEFGIPNRHLGLMTAEEEPLGRENIEKLADTILRYIDIDGLIRGAACRFVYPLSETEETPEPKVRIAIARDRAFSFYYEDNLDMLRDAGADLVRFSPLTDATIPEADAVYLGGGYPELHAHVLSSNKPMRDAIRSWAESGKTLYAECGGLMYLSRSISRDGVTFPMAGVFPFETRMLARPRLGYREVVLRGDSIIGREGDIRRGHEFHYSEIAGGADGTAYRVTDSRGKALPDQGVQYKRTLASYVHLHFGSAPHCAEKIISQIRGDGNV